MADKYWTDSWGIVHGCTPVSPACLHCWAASEAHMRAHQKNPKTRAKYEGLTFKKDGIPTFNGMVRLDYDALDKPLRARKPRIYAVGWGGDLFHEDVPDHFRDKVYAVQALCRQHVFLDLTKRAKRLAAYWSNPLKRYELIENAACEIIKKFGNRQQKWNANNRASAWQGLVWNGSESTTMLAHVWHGVTVENQATANERILHLLKVPGKRWISVEPGLGAVELTLMFPRENEVFIHGYDALRGSDTTLVKNDNRREWWGRDFGGNARLGERIHQVIAGGETGHGARPSHPDYFRSLRDQCQAAGTAFYFKGYGKKRPCGGCSGMGYRNDAFGNGRCSSCKGKGWVKPSNRLLDGWEHNELAWKEDYGR